MNSLQAWSTLMTGYLEFDAQPLCRAFAVLNALRHSGHDLDKWLGGAELSNKAIHLQLGELFASSIDVLNRFDQQQRYAVYEYFASQTVLLPDVFAFLRQAEEPERDIKATGAIYTPYWLARHIVVESLRNWRKLHRSGRRPVNVGDPSCGTGIFLAAANEQFGPDTQIYGSDVDQVAIGYAELLETTLRARWRLVHQDTLISRPQIRPSLFDFEGDNEPLLDIMVGNPPFVRSLNLDSTYVDTLRTRTSILGSGHFDLSILFLEHALASLSDGGLFSYIVTSKFMSAKYGKNIASHLATKGRVIKIEDLGDQQIFPGYTTYTCILTVAKATPIKRFTVTRYPTGFEANAKPQNYTLPTERLLNHPWDFTEGNHQKALQKLKDNQHPLLCDVFNDLTQGLRTGANQVYILPAEKTDRSGSDLLVPFVSGEEIRRMRIDTGKLRLLFPYEANGLGGLKPITEKRLRGYQATWDFLMSKKVILEERARDANSPWYAFSRSQNLDVVAQPKILIREMMPRMEVAADFNGNIAFSAGYALIARRLTNEDLLLWSAVLNTRVMEFSLRNQSTQLHSGWFRVLKHFLDKLRLPRLSTRQRKHALSLAQDLNADPENEQAWTELNNLVSRAFGLSDEEISCIDAYLADCYKRSLPNAAVTERRDFELDEDSLEQPIAVRQERNYEPVKLPQYDALHRERFDLRQLVTFKPNKDRPIHRWYQYTQGFSSDLVSALFHELSVTPDTMVLDPFTGCGTTNVVSLQAGIPSVGVEISPLMVWIAKAKTRRWNIEEVQTGVQMLAQHNIAPVAGYERLFGSYLDKAFAPEILAQITGIAAHLLSDEFTAEQREFLQLGLVSILEDVSQIRKHGSHYRFMTNEDSIGLQKLSIQIVDPSQSIVPILVDRLNQMTSDIWISPPGANNVRCDILASGILTVDSEQIRADVVITSPPYLNRNNYLAQQKAELSILGLLSTEEQFQSIVRSSIRSHTDAEYGSEPVTSVPEVARILEELQLEPGNNTRIPHMIAGYFEDIAAVLRRLYAALAPNARCAFVVGNSRWGGVVVPVDHLLLLLAEQIGFTPRRVLVTRYKGNSPQQMKRYGRIPVRESIVIFEKH